MKTPPYVNALLDIFADQYGIDIANAQQGSTAWYQLKLGVISASNASKAVAKKDSETRASYMAELGAQVATGLMEEINSRHLDWGNDHEDAARAMYEFTTGNKVVELPFVFKDSSFRAGCSPDGIVSESKGMEIKCPSNSANYMKFLTDDKIKSEYVWQAQFTLWVMDADQWDFVQYDPRFQRNPMKVLTLERDEEKMKTLDDAIPQFISDMDRMLGRAGFEFGQHWARLTEQPAGEAVS